jgi:hypothetical protein
MLIITKWLRCGEVDSHMALAVNAMSLSRSISEKFLREKRRDDERSSSGWQQDPRAIRETQNEGLFKFAPYVQAKSL